MFLNLGIVHIPLAKTSVVIVLGGACDFSCFRSGGWWRGSGNNFKGLNNIAHKCFPASGILLVFSISGLKVYKTLQINQTSMIGIVNCSALVFVFFLLVSVQHFHKCFIAIQTESDFKPDKEYIIYIASIGGKTQCLHWVINCWCSSNQVLFIGDISERALLLAKCCKIWSIEP